MVDTILDTLLDTLKMIPILFLVYVLIEVIQTRMSTDRLSELSSKGYGPAVGALAGSIPQCGFSAAASALYKNGMICSGTLVAVFVATSDEAIPVLLSHTDRLWDVVWLIAVKIAAAVAGGYAVYFISRTVRRKAQKSFDENSAEEYKHEHEHEHFHDCHHPCHCGSGVKSVIKNSVMHTVKISVFVLITLLVINIIFYLAGEENVSAVLLSGNVFQPFLTALIGVIPGCATSVMLTELYIGGTLSFGSAVAGLCTGAGFGYIILFKDKNGLKNNFMILASVYIIGVISGVVINLFV